MEKTILGSKGIKGRQNLANLVALSCWMLSLSRFTLVMPVQLALPSSTSLPIEIVSITAQRTVRVFGDWSRSVWSLFNLTTMSGPTGVGTPGSFTLGITGTSKLTTMAIISNIYNLVFNPKTSSLFPYVYYSLQFHLSNTHISSLFFSFLFCPIFQMASQLFPRVNLYTKQYQLFHIFYQLLQFN